MLIDRGGTGVRCSFRLFCEIFGAFSESPKTIRVIQLFGPFYSDLADFEGQFGLTRHRRPGKSNFIQRIKYMCFLA